MQLKKKPLSLEHQKLASKNILKASSISGFCLSLKGGRYRYTSTRSNWNRVTSARTTTLRSEKLPFQVVILNNLWESMVQFLLNLGVQTRVPYRAKGIWCGCISRTTATPPLSTRGSRLPLKQVCVFPFNLVRNIHYHIYSCNYKL